MGTITKLGMQHPSNRIGVSPYGNLSAFRFLIMTNAAGALVDGDSAEPITIDDMLLIGILPAGFRMIDSMVKITSAMSTGVVASLGFEYVDGVDDQGVPQNDSHFGSSMPLDTVGCLRDYETEPSFTLPKDAWVTLTITEGTNAKASELEIIVFAINEGVV